MPDAADLEALWPVVLALRSLGVEFHVGGSVASNVYGQWRQTNDTDLVAAIRYEHAEPLVARLAEDYYIDAHMIRDAIKEQGSFNVIHNNTAQKVDVFVAKRRPFDVSAAKRVTLMPVSEDGRFELPIASPEDVILSKLEWFRKGGEQSTHQLQDVISVMRIQRDRLDLSYMRRWADELQVRDLLEKALSETDESRQQGFAS